MNGALACPYIRAKEAISSTGSPVIFDAHSGDSPFALLYLASARKAGMTEAMLGELMAVVGMANETNRLADGYQIEIDEMFRTPPA